MKRLYTLVMAAVASLAASASLSIKDGATWNPWNADATEIATAADGSVSFHFTEAWSGAGLWVGIGEGEEQEGADWSDYDYLVYEVKDCTASCNICIEYTDNTINSETGILKLVDTKSSGSINAIKGYGALALDVDYSDRVAQTWIQPIGTGDCTITDIVLMTEDEFLEFKESKNKPSGDVVTLWEGSKLFDNTWPSIQLASSNFEDIEAGYELTVTISEIVEISGWQYGTQLFCNNSNWENISGMKIEGITETGDQTFVIAEENLEVIKTGGIILQGMGCIVTKITLGKPSASDPETVAWEGEQEILSWSGNVYASADGFDGIKEGDKLTVYYSAMVEEATTAGETWYQAKFNLGDTWDDGNTMTSNADQLNDWKCLDLSADNNKYEMTLNATDAEGLAAGGMRIQGHYIKVTKIAFTPASGIREINVTPVANNKIYNLLGQEVDENYHGLVIMNGRKMLR